MGFKFREPLALIEGTGLTIDPNNTEMFGTVSPSQTITISIGQDVATSSNVTFYRLKVTPNKFIIGSNALILEEGVISGSFTQSGTLTTTENLITNGNLTIKGTTTARKIESQLSQSVTLFESGSSVFGDTSDDSHQFSGSVQISGSLALSENVTVHEISNDTSLTDNSPVALVTSNAVKNYLNDGTDTVNSYLRKCFTKTGSFISTSTSSFTATTASAPSGMTATSEDDFMFFMNGQMMEHDALTVQQSGSVFYLKLDNDALGYDLVNDDEVVAWGKFDRIIYLSFDGLTNEVTTNFSGSNATSVNKTYSWWMNATETDVNKGVFGYGSDKREAFLINHSQNAMGKPIIKLANHMYKYFMTPGHEEDGGGTSGNADGGADEATAHIEAQDDGQWHHWMLFSDPSDPENSKLYIDGVEQDTAKFANTGTTNTQQDSLSIGTVDSGNTTGEHFSGDIREFSVFSGDKTSNASTYYNGGSPYDVTNESDLQGYWKMDEASGSIANDSSGEGNHGTIDGATWSIV